MSPRFLWSMIMARKLDRILVVDIEATCWEGNPPPGQTSEIIEIGTFMAAALSTLLSTRRHRR